MSVTYYSGKQTGNLIIDALTDGSGSKWGDAFGSGAIITYSFPWTTNADASWSDGYSEPNALTVDGLNNAQVSSARDIFGIYSSFANLQFNEIQESGSSYGDIRIAFSSEVGDGTWGYAYYPNKYYESGGDVWINDRYIGEDFLPGGYNFNALMHEMGHVLGLKHPFEGDYVLPEDEDHGINTIMSYTDFKQYIPIVTASKQPNGGTSIHAEYQGLFTQTPMVYDIAALQAIYGANTASETGDNFYYFESTEFYKTIWDAGGEDTIDCSAITNPNYIDLNDGSYSNINYRNVESQILETQASVQSELGTNYYASWISDVYTSQYDAIYTGENALGIAYGAVIENAIGGSASDTLIGNDTSNILKGMSGNDSLQGGLGDDILIGGIGEDIYHYTMGDGNDIIIDSNYTLTHVTHYHGFRKSHYTKYANTGDNALELNSGISLENIDAQQEGNDLVLGFRNSQTESTPFYELTDRITLNNFYTVERSVKMIQLDNAETLDLTTWRVGTSGNDNLFGSGYLSGGAGNDVIYSSSLVDVLVGGDGLDTYIFQTPLSLGMSVDTIADFRSIDDTIQLENGFFATLTTVGTLNAINFVANTSGTAQDTNDYIVYNTTTGALYYDTDGNGAAVAIQFALLGSLTHPTITNADLFVS